MARYFAPISLRDFRAKIDEIWDGEMYGLNRLTPQIKNDLEKVEFDMENASISDAFCWKNDKNLLGYQELDNGMMLLGANCGGDWETPIYFCIYFSGKELRAYIPKNGNTWNPLNHKALGNDVEGSDTDYVRSLFPNIPDLDIEEAIANVFLDKELIVKDIKERILKKG